MSDETKSYPDATDAESASAPCMACAANIFNALVQSAHPAPKQLSTAMLAMTMLLARHIDSMPQGFAERWLASLPEVVGHNARAMNAAFRQAMTSDDGVKLDTGLLGAPPAGNA